MILLHGIGSDGEDLINLADVFASDLPDTVFHAPNAPEPYAEGGFGYQWYPRHTMTENGNEKRLERTVNDYIDGLLVDYGLDASRCVLVGFSQGSIVAMHIAPRRADPLAGVVAFSGSMPTAGTLREEKASAPPMVLIHGSEDTVLRPEESQKAAELLREADIPAALHILPGLPHAIDHRGIRIAMEFVKRALNIP